MTKVVILKGASRSRRITNPLAASGVLLRAKPTQTQQDALSIATNKWQRTGASARRGKRLTAR